MNVELSLSPTQLDPAQYRQSLYAHARAITGDAGLAEDAVQEAFLRLIQHSDRGSIQSVKAFLHSVVRNVSIDQVRREAVRHRRGVGVPLVENGKKTELAESCARALDALPPDQREIVVLKIYCGLTIQEAALQMGIPFGTAASRYRYALEKLAEILS